VIVVLFYLIDFSVDFFWILPKFGRLAASMCVVWWYVYIYINRYLYFIIYDYVIYLSIIIIIIAYVYLYILFNIVFI
jgi:hypothetical protein